MHDEMVIAKLREMSSWNSFAASLIAQFDQKGKLSEKQIGAAKRMFAKMEANAKAKAEMTTQVDMSAIETMFANAVKNGLKRPGFICGDIRLSLAVAPSRNAGAIYVKHSGEYMGKIAGGTFHPIAACLASVPAMVQAIAANPMQSAIGHGRQTGMCACCGRELSDPESVARGIGPICAKKWGFE